jgi:hypothetical protein
MSALDLPSKLLGARVSGGGWRPFQQIGAKLGRGEAGARRHGPEKALQSSVCTAISDVGKRVVSQPSLRGHGATLGEASARRGRGWNGVAQ